MMTDDAVRAAAVDDGWEARRVSLYDEEGVDGWGWSHPARGGEHCEVGGWEEPPPIPEAVRLVYDAEYREQRQRERDAAKAEGERFAAFLDGLLHERPRQQP